MPIWPVIVFVLVAVILLGVSYLPVKGSVRGFLRAIGIVFFLAAIVMFIFYNVFPPAPASPKASPPYTPVGR